MGKSNMNTIVAFLLIAVIIGVGVVIGNSALTGTEQEVFYDFNNLDLLNQTNVAVVDTSIEYNSLSFQSGFVLNNPISTIIDFGEDLTGVNEYTIEMQIDFSGLNDSVPEGIEMAWALESKVFESNISLLTASYLSTNLISTMGLSSDALALDLVLEPTSSIGNINLGLVELGAGVYNTKYIINTESNYIVETTTFDFTDVTLVDIVETRFTMIADDFSIATDLGSNGNFAFNMENSLLTNELSNTTSYTIDFIKLSYEEVAVQ